VNIARILFDAYPDSDLLPLDPDQDCRDLQSLLTRVRNSNIGDTLFQFLVLEMAEGGEGTLDGAIRVTRKARDDVDAVLRALTSRRRKEPSMPSRTSSAAALRGGVVRDAVPLHEPNP
jgi:glutathione S-transferase